MNRIADLFRTFARWTSLLAVLAVSEPVLASDFSLAVSPPHFELKAKPGETVRGVFEIDNTSSSPTPLGFQTADWILASDGGLSTQTELASGSCRPWVAIERREFQLAAKSQMRYRYEVSVPPSAEAGECRFAILVSGNDERLLPAPNLAVPITPQIALIVYVAIGDAKPRLTVVKAEIDGKSGQQLPALLIHNEGLAHGRLSAFLHGVDAQGKKFEFTPSTLPVLPGETRSISLNIDHPSDEVLAQPKPVLSDRITFPIKIVGTLSDGTRTFPFEGVFAP